MDSKDFAKQYAQLNPAQKLAVNTIDGPVMVIAGPGTGKTQLLTLRAANILQKTDTEPKNILCLTYTEVGARNMRDRLAKLVGQAAYDIRISTYHGLGSELIRQYGEYFNQYGDEQPVDKLGQDKILHEIFDELPASNPLWRADIYLKNTLDFISECKRALLSPDDIRIIANSNKQFIERASNITMQYIPAFPRVNKQVVNYFIDLLEQINPVISEQKLPARIKPLSELFYNDLSSAIAEYNETNKTTPITKFKNKWLEKNNQNQWILQGKRDIYKLQGGADIYEKYLTALHKNKLFDYDDMIMRAIHGLEQNDDLRYSLHEQYLYIMLDEFQDTNLAQLRLVELLTNNPVHDCQPNILAVGDDDQAIFSFQGAELGNMVKFTEMYKHVSIITLTDNYRSHADILHTAHNIAQNIDERLTTTLGKGDKILSAKNPNITSAKITRQHFKSDIAQYDWVAKQVDKLIKNGTPASEIAILAPKHKYIEPLVPYMMAKNIPIRYDKRENVLEDKYIVEIINMAQLVMAIADNNFAAANSLWPIVLSADYWQIATSTIWQLSWQSYDNNFVDDKTSYWQALMMDNADLKPIAIFFAKLGQLQANETLETMFDYLVGVEKLDLKEPDMDEFQSPYYEYYFGTKARDKSPTTFTAILSNLTVLRQSLREYRRETDQPLRLQDMLDFIADYQAAGEKLLNTSPYHSSDDAVQLMTAYGSKGLEFETVIILATHDEVWGIKDRSPNNNISLPPNLAPIRRAGSTKDEKRRLFYVAITRAKNNLILTSYSQNYAGKTRTSLEFLNEVDNLSPNLVTQHQQIHTDDSEVPAIETLQHFWTSRHAEGVYDASMRDIVLPRLETFQLSATHLNNFTDLVYGGPEAFFTNTILKFPKAPTSDGQFGNAIHETIEAMQHNLKRTGELPDTDQSIEIFYKKLKQKKLSDNEYKRLAGRGSEALKKFIPWWWHNFTPQAQTEYSFRNEGVFIGDAHLSGNLDQILVDADTKQVRVVDFKTGKTHNRWIKDIKTHKYKQQLIFYKILVENSHSFKGYDVDEAKLVFVEPDSYTGDMNELPIVFKSDEIEHTTKLIQAVWKRIKNLDLPDTSQFSPDLKGIEAFEDWLIKNTA